MAEILETLGISNQLGKALLYELLGQIAKDKNASSSVTNKGSPLCKSVPVSPSDAVPSEKKTASDGEIENSQPTNNTLVDSSLGRPRYQWNSPDAESGRAIPDLKQLYSVYVGHLPTDITQGELTDLFSDVGEVVDSFVFPPTNGHTYTYGFVRFSTLDEAKDAIREKNSKVIGSRQINVELSSCTKRNLQANNDEEDSRPLLQKEYLKVQRTTDNDEKQVIEKLKASLLRLNNNRISAFGDYNPDEVFENIKSILKLLINYPMSLADPSPDTGEGKSSLNDTQSMRSPLRSSCGEIANNQPTLQQCQTTSRLPASALECAKISGTNNNKAMPKSGIPLIEENNVPASEHVKSSVTNKIRDFLDSSSVEDNVLPSRSQRLVKKTPDSKQYLSSSSTDDELNINMKPTTKPPLERYNKLPIDLITPDPSSKSSVKYQAQRLPSDASDTIGFTQIKSNDVPVEERRDSNDETTLFKTKQNTSGIPSTEALSHLTISMQSASEPMSSLSFVLRTSSDENAYFSRDVNGTIPPLVELPSSLKQCSEHVTDKQNVGKLDDSATRSSSMSGVKNGEKVPLSSSCTVNAMSQCISPCNDTIRHSSCNLHSSREPVYDNSLGEFCLSGSTSLKVSEARRLSPNSSDQEVESILGKDVQRGSSDTTPIYDLLNNLNQQNSATGSYCYFPLPPSNVNNDASLERQELAINNLAINNLARVEEKSYAEATTFYSETGTFSSHSYPDIPVPILNAGRIPSPRLFSQEMEELECSLSPSKQTMPNKHLQSSLNVNAQIKSTSSARKVDDKRWTIPNEHKQYKFSQQDMGEMKTKEHSLSNQKLLDQPIPQSSVDESFQHNKKLSNVQNISDVSNYLSQTSLHNSLPIETVASNVEYDFSLQLPNVQSTLLQETRALGETDQFDNVGQGNVQIPVDSETTQSRSLLPSPSSLNTREVVNHSPWELRNGSHSSNSTLQSQADCLITAKDIDMSSNGGMLSPNGELNSPAERTTVQDVFDSFCTNDVDGQRMVEKEPIENDRSTVSTVAKGSVKFPTRRILAPSFSFLPSKKNESGKIQTHFNHETQRLAVDSSINTSNVSVNKTVKFQSKKTADVMGNDSAIVSISTNEDEKSAFGMSEFDLTLEDTDISRSLVLDPVSESRMSLLDSRCPSDDAETIKLKDQLNEIALKLEESQQTFNKYPQRRRKRLPNFFDDHARSSKLERQIHDAEILLQKRVEMWTTRSNERELAYEKEMFHSTDGSPLLAQFAREMKKDWLRNEIYIADLKCKIFQLKIEQCQREETAHT